VLAHQSSALMGRNRGDFLSGIDSSPAAAAYRREQASDYANLAGVPLAAWRYAVVGPISDNAVRRSAQSRYHAPVLLLHVTLEYELRGIDALPDRHDQYLAFVERGRQARLAGGDVLAAQGTPSWVPPWRFGPLVAARGSASLVLGPPADRAMLPALAHEVDAAAAAVTGVWGADWSQHVAALIPTGEAEFRALGGFPEGGGAPDVSAFATTGGLDARTGRPYGQRLVLDPTQLARLTPVGRGIVLRHEITHLATAADTADITPRWLVEGFAEYVANLGTGQSVPVAAAELHRAVAAGSVPAALPGDGGFASSGAALARAYEASWLACRLIAQRAGQAGLIRFYRRIGTALATRAQAVTAAFRAVLHETQGAFTRQWRTYVKDLSA
jgi:hypothetical protein